MARWKHELSDKELLEEDRGIQGEMKGAVGVAVSGLNLLIEHDALVSCPWCRKPRPFSDIKEDPERDPFACGGNLHCGVCRKYKRMKGHYPFKAIGC